ncbi:MAG TPA: hypothetical protein VM616_07440 [Gammaproteobacteria bacterium]|nr:hypothetical protein [Gammaproteobacteria bacterium]
MRRAFRDIVDLAGKVWTLPNTAAGIVVGLAGLLLGTRISFGNNAIQFERFPVGTGALTLGNVVIYGRGTAPGDIRRLYGSTQRLSLAAHERAHTYQYQALGPFFLPVYFAFGGIHARNPFERAANAYAEGGHWWPWRR